MGTIRDLGKNKLSVPSILLGILLFMLGVFAALTLLVHFGRLVNADFNFTVKLQDRISTRWDNEFAYLVDLGSMEIMTIILLIILVFLPIEKRYKLAIVMLYFIGLGVIWLGKETLHHPAPPYLFHRGGTGMHFPSSYVQIQYSYPSGHTYRSFFVATLLILYAFLSKKKVLIKCILILMSAIVAIGIASALIVLGKHWVSDVIGGGSLAIGIASSIFLLSQWKKGNNTTTKKTNF